MANPRLRPVKPRLWRLQFSLAGLFVLMTLASVAVWVGYQWPYEVVNKQHSFRQVETVRRNWRGTVRHGPRRVYDAQNNPLIEENYRNGQQDGEFITYKSAGQKESLVTYQRGQKHGPSRQWDRNGALIQEENYRRGLPHGTFVVHRLGVGTLLAEDTMIEGAFNQGQPSGQWTWFPRTCDWPAALKNPRAGGTITGQWRDGQADGRWEWRDASDRVYLTADFTRGQVTATGGANLSPSLPKLIERAASAEPRLFLTLFGTVNLHVVDKPLKEALIHLRASGNIPIRHETRRWEVVGVSPDSPVPLQPENIPIRIDDRRLKLAGVSPDSPVTCQVDQAPLVIALGTMLEPLDLGCDYRYGMLCIDSLESIAGWKDTTGVPQIVPPRRSRLAREWTKTIDLKNVFEMPLKDVMQFLADKHGVRIDLSRLPQPRDSDTDLLTAETRVTAPIRGISFRDALAIILDRVGGKATLQAETIVIESL